jgi:excisionase family DNA binding protein
MEDKPDELMTTPEVARILRVSRATVARYVRLGQLPAIRLPSGVIRIPRSAVQKLLDQQHQP